MKQKTFLVYGLCLILAMVFFLNLHIEAQQEQPSKEDSAEDRPSINLNFVDTELEVFVEFVAKMTSKRMLYDSSIKGKKIFIISPMPVTRAELYRIFLGVIEYNGFILETTGSGTAEIIKIKRNIQGPWTQTPIYQEKELSKVQDQDEFITMVIKLKYISSREVQTTLRALRIVNPQGGNLAGIEGSNTILLTDYAPNVRRIYEVIKLMDEEGPQRQSKVIPLRHAIADDVAEQLKEFFKQDRKASSAGFGGGPDMEEIKIMADKRLNALIVQAYEGRIGSIVSLVEELDRRLEDEPTNIHYLRLKHADASKLQETLDKLIQSGALTKRPATPSSTSSSTAAAGSTDESSVAIQAEPQTNSLIVRADEHQWKELEKIISAVDVRRPQIFLEGALVEVSPENTLTMGVELFGFEETDSERLTFGGGSNFGLSNLVVVDGSNNAKPVSTTTSGTGNKKFGKVPTTGSGGIGLINYKDIFTIPVLMQALQTQGNFRIISLPRILTNDHQQAQLKVTDQRPATTTSESSSGSVVTSFSGFQEAGTVLNITPHISGEKNYLRIDVEQSIEEFDLSQQIKPEILPPKRTRKITTSVTVPDGQTIAIGGLTFDSEEESLKKIPLFGDLPLIGFLFQQRTVTHRKRNIYLFITPHILREEGFKDLIQYSYASKMDAQTFGVNMDLVDKSLRKYQRKYDLEGGGMEPLYMLEYTPPSAPAAK